MYHNQSSVHAEGNSVPASNSISNNEDKSNQKDSLETATNSLGPTVKLSESTSNLVSERKPTIGIRKIQNKRSGVCIQMILYLFIIYVEHILMTFFILTFVIQS